MGGKITIGKAKHVYLLQMGGDIIIVERYSQYIEVALDLNLFSITMFMV